MKMTGARIAGVLTALLLGLHCVEAGAQASSHSYSFDIAGWDGLPILDEQGVFERCTAWTPAKGGDVIIAFSGVHPDQVELRVFIKGTAYTKGKSYLVDVYFPGDKSPLPISMVAREPRELGVYVSEHPEILKRLSTPGRLTAIVRGDAKGQTHNAAVSYTNAAKAAKAVEDCARIYSSKEAKSSTIVQVSQGTSSEQQLAKLYDQYLTVQWCSKPIDMGLVIVPTTLKPEQVEQAKAAMRVIDASFKEQKIDTDAVWATASQKFSEMLTAHQKKVEPQRKLLQLSGEAPKEADAEGRLVMGLTCNAALEAILDKTGMKKGEDAVPMLKKDF